MIDVNVQTGHQYWRPAGMLIRKGQPSQMYHIEVYLLVFVAKQADFHVAAVLSAPKAAGEVVAAQTQELGIAQDADRETADSCSLVGFLAPV